jgi:hypothetical protein
MAQLGARLVDNGFSIIPIKPGEKVPGILTESGWHPLKNWTQYARRLPGADELEAWSAMPGVGIGVVCGNVVGVDIDVLRNRALADRIAGLARKMLGDDSLVRVGQAPKRLMVYRADKPFRGIKKHPIEILGEGQQFVIEGIHPVTGKPYYWEGESLADIDISQLPVVTEEQCRRFVEAAYKLLPPELRQSALSSGNGSPYHSPGRLAGTYEAIDSALRIIPNDDLNYDDWVRIGLAIKGAVGDSGEALFARWSSLSSKNVPETTAKTWVSLRPREVGAGTIYYLAEERGWVCPSHLIMDAAAEAAIDAHPAQGLLDSVAAGVPAVEAAPEPVPEAPVVPGAFYELDGVLGQMVDYIVSTAIQPQPVLAAAAAICAVGVLAGRKYRSESNLRTNLYTISIAESGGGKDHARKCIEMAFAEAGLSGHIGGGRLTSGAGLLSALKRQPDTLFQLDEFGQFLLNVTAERAPKHVREVWDYFTELYTSAGTLIRGAEYADQKTNPMVNIMQPCAVVHATTVPAPFWRALQSGSLNDGSFARWLIFNSDTPIPDPVRSPQPINLVPESLSDGLRAIAAGTEGWRKQDSVFMGAIGNPTPHLVPYTLEAARFLWDFKAEVIERQRANIGTPQSAVLARIVEHVIKLALLRAVSTSPARPVITLADVCWAQAIVEHCTGRMIADADRYVADNETEATYKNILEIIRTGGSKGIERWRLSRAMKKLKSKELRDFVQSMVDANLVEVIEKKTDGRPAVFFRALRED